MAGILCRRLTANRLVFDVGCVDVEGVQFFHLRIQIHWISGIIFPVQQWEDYFNNFPEDHVMTPVIPARHQGVAEVADNVEEDTVMVAAQRVETQRGHLSHHQTSRPWKLVSHEI